METRAAIISLVTKSTGQLKNVQCKLEASVNTIRRIREATSGNTKSKRACAMNQGKNSQARGLGEHLISNNGNFFFFN